MDNILTKEDIDFLKELGNELKNQDNAGTAKPLFHQVMDQYWEYGIDVDCADEEVICIGDEYHTFHTVDEAKNFLDQNYLNCYEDSEDLQRCTRFDSIEHWCNKRDIQCTITGGREMERYQNAFLTRKACEKHIQQNYYHYKQGKKSICYTQHGWRNPELKRLLEIVEKFADGE